jgi:hypothetical protein
VSPKDTQTTGILIWSAVSKYHFTVTKNIIFNNAVGVWFTPATIQASGSPRAASSTLPLRYCLAS